MRNSTYEVECPSCRRRTPHALIRGEISLAWCQICFRAREIQDDEISLLPPVEAENADP